jgi:hypothetical protein
VEITKTKTLTDSQFQQINRLWNEAYPENFKDRFGLLLDGVLNYNHYLIEGKNNTVLAWAVDFKKDNEVRFSIIVTESQKGKGFGGQLMNRLKNEHDVFFGWVIDHGDDKKLNGENYISPLSFYLKQGGEVLPNIRLDTEIVKAVKIKFIGKQNK